MYTMWIRFVNFEERRKKEIPFLLEQLKDYENPHIFDAALGSGATSLGLRFAGIEHLVSNEIDPHYRQLAEQEALRYGVPLSTTAHSWEEIGSLYPSSFDAITCLGNSLTLLFDREEQLSALRSFREALTPEGKLIIDERNYPALFLSDHSGRNYRWSGTVVYCGREEIDAYPVSITYEEIVMEYKDRRTHESVRLTLYPFKTGELKALLHEVGFSTISTYDDYQEHSSHTPEFFTHVCTIS
ncbi:class I SAM-dependent methyltransferase [Candidatus Woesearchaeota archaeon]|nr:class I SAM-dependent methyltransferase [Candidatus Woesearchaeota archaeon]